MTEAWRKTEPGSATEVLIWSAQACLPFGSDRLAARGACARSQLRAEKAGASSRTPKNSWLSMVFGSNLSIAGLSSSAMPSPQPGLPHSVLPLAKARYGIASNAMARRTGDPSS